MLHEPGVGERLNSPKRRPSEGQAVAQTFGQEFSSGACVITYEPSGHRQPHRTGGGGSGCLNLLWALAVAQSHGRRGGWGGGRGGFGGGSFGGGGGFGGFGGGGGFSGGGSSGSW